MTSLKRGLSAFEAIINGMFGILLCVMIGLLPLLSLERQFPYWSRSFRRCQQVTKASSFCCWRAWHSKVSKSGEFSRHTLIQNHRLAPRLRYVTSRLQTSFCDFSHFCGTCITCSGRAR